MPSYTATKARSSSRARLCTLSMPDASRDYTAVTARSASRMRAAGVGDQPGDDFYAPIVLTPPSADVSVMIDDYSIQDGETDLGSADRTVWFRVWPPASGELRIDPTGFHNSDIDVWDGDDITTLQPRLDPVTGLPEGSTDYTSPIVISVNEATRIRALRQYDSGETGYLAFDWSFTPAGGVLELEIANNVITETPAVLRVSVMGAEPGETVRFQVAGESSTQDFVADSTGVLSGVAVQAPRGLSVGTHVLRAEGLTSGYDDDVTFTVLNLVTRPEAPPAGDAAVPVTQSGVRRWVFQDPMSGGLGEYVLPLNPDAMSDPFPERYFTPEHTTSYAGAWILWEGAERATAWRFSGQALLEAQVDELREWARCRRRIHIHDHRNRAFLVRITGADITPAPKAKYPKRHTYEFRADVFGWVQL